MPVTLDPRWPKERLARVGMDISFAWLTFNHLPLPDRVFFDRKSANNARRAEDPRSKYMMAPEWLGVYQRARNSDGWNAIAVDVEGCHAESRLRPVNGEAFWQAPGSYMDFTPLGVFCHEVGHHVDYVLHPKAYSMQNGFEEIVDNEEEISTVEANVPESFAEAIRLFVTNPDLLRQGRPERYEYLTKGMGLKPLHSHGWKRVLRSAGKRVNAAAAKWIAL